MSIDRFWPVAATPLRKTNGRSRTMIAAVQPSLINGRVRPVAVCRALEKQTFTNFAERPGVMLPTNGGQSDQALVDSSKASGAT